MSAELWAGALWGLILGATLTDAVHTVRARARVHAETEAQRAGRALLSDRWADRYAVRRDDGSWLVFACGLACLSTSREDAEAVLQAELAAQADARLLTEIATHTDHGRAA